MDLIDFKEDKQREILKKIGEALIKASEEDDADTLEIHLETLQDGYLDVLGPDDFFGTEGWEYWLGLD